MALSTVLKAWPWSHRVAPVQPQLSNSCKASPSTSSTASMVEGVALKPKREDENRWLDTKYSLSWDLTAASSVSWKRKTQQLWDGNFQTETDCLSYVSNSRLLLILREIIEVKHFNETAMLSFDWHSRQQGIQDCWMKQVQFWIWIKRNKSNNTLNPWRRCKIYQTMYMNCYMY